MTQHRSLAAALVVLAGLLVLPGVALASSLSLTQLPGGKYPQRTYLLSSSTPLPTQGNQLRVSENGKPVRNLHVQASGTVGGSQFGTVVLIDTSESMKGAGLSRALTDARTFVGARAPTQPDGIVFFNSGATVAAPMTTNGGVLAKALSGTPATRVGTHIFDAASLALSMLHRSGVATGLIVLLSDGRDTGSKISEAAVAKAAAAAGVRVYSIGVKDPSFDGSTLTSLSNITHGVYETSTSPGVLSLFKRIGSEDSSEYTITYTSAAAAGQPVNVSVNVPGAGAATAAYTAPGTPATPAPLGPPVTHSPSTANKSFLDSGAGVALFCLVFGLLIGGAVLLVTSRRGDVSRRVGGFVSPKSERQQAANSFVERALGDKQSRSIARSPFMTRFKVELEVAEIEQPLDRLLAATVIVMVLVGWLLVTEVSSPLAAPLALLVPLIGYNAVRFMADRQRRQFGEQLPDNLQVVASAMRAGQTFVGALQSVVDDSPEPSRRELRRAMTDEALGIPLVDALGQMSERMESEDFQHVTVVAALQRDTGGNTAEVIDLVSDTIRERIEIRRMVRGLTAQGRLAGFVLSMLPIGLLVIISVMNPAYTHPLFHSTIGIVALIVGVVLAVLGSLAIRRVVNIKV